MKVFITATFKNGENRQEIEKLCSVIKNAGFVDFCFIRDVENYQKVYIDPKELMQRSREEINKCEALLIEATEKSTGRAIEAGIAYSLGKKIIVIIRKDTAIKDTLRGVADAVIEYTEIEDLAIPLKKLYLKWYK
jgi:nucleoside 2-deoxyribosyltransferase